MILRILKPILGEEMFPTKATRTNAKNGFPFEKYSGRVESGPNIIKVPWEFKSNQSLFESEQSVMNNKLKAKERSKKIVMNMETLVPIGPIELTGSLKEFPRIDRRYFFNHSATITFLSSSENIVNQNREFHDW